MLIPGLGIWAGSAFANFDESDRGNPDILVQFMLMGTSAFISSILLILPASVMLYNHNIGLLAGGIFVLLSFAIMFAGIRAVLRLIVQSTLIATAFKISSK